MKNKYTLKTIFKTSYIIIILYTMLEEKPIKSKIAKKIIPIITVAIVIAIIMIIVIIINSITISI